METDASEAGELRRLLEQQSGQRVAEFVGLMPRNMILDILRANVPNALDFLEPAIEEGQRRMLLVAVTKNVYRFEAVERGPLT